MSLLRVHLTRSTTSTSTLLRRTFRTTPYFFQESSTPTVLSSLQPDLKNSLRSKDKPRLTVLRSLLAEITNASKTPKPINNDSQFYALLLRQIKSSNTAIEEFSAAKREDLVEKEKGQLNVLEEYATRIPKVGEAEIANTVKEVKEQLEKSGSELKAGVVMGKVMGSLAAKGLALDTDLVKKKVEEAIGGSAL